ncbi:MAG: CPBP family glutamic-type intramembrane protease [Chloroflexi bacterium]|nr:CPBP family glutamic-type intramembrane protease [Chloroflexota bacterium]
MKHGNLTAASTSTTKAMNWRLFFLLWLASVIGVILVLPYGLTMIPASLAAQLPPLPLLILAQVAQGAILLGFLTLAGLFFANRTGLSVPILEAWIAGQGIRTRLKSILVPSILVGVVGTLLILALEVVVFQPTMQQQNQASASALSLWSHPPAAWKGLLASFYGGIDEEILLRLFALSLLAWLGSFVHRKPDGRPSGPVLWVANTIAAVLFGLGHLPLVSALVALTPLIIVRAVVLNGLLGLGFGYLYWTRGLESAMLSHFSADLLLHVVLAL